MLRCFVVLPCRSSHYPACPLRRQQPHWHYDHPLQQHWQGSVQSVYASCSQWATLIAAEAQWRTGVLWAAGHCQQHWWSIWEDGVLGLLMISDPLGVKSSWIWCKACSGFRKKLFLSCLFLGLCSSILHLWLCLGILEESLQTLQPCLGWNVWELQRRQRIPIH